MSKKALVLLVVVVLINAFANSSLQLHYDEAYYWVWSQHLALSYFDHPPMIAYMIRLSCLLGRSEFFVRLPAVITSSITIITLFRLAQKMFGNKVATISVYLAIATPILEGAFFIVTPDCPLNMFWLLALLAFYNGIFEDKPRHIYLAGVWSGLALLSKYTGVLIFPGIFLFLLFTPHYRYYLWRKEVYLAGIVALIIFTPVIWWNYQHQWISFAFQLNHGFDGIKHMRFSSVGDFIGGQIGVGGPLIMLALVYYLLRYNVIHLHNDKLAFLFWPWIFVFMFFAYSSLYAYVGANWTSPALISTIPLTAYWLARLNKQWIYRSSLIIIFIAMAMVKLPNLFISPRLAQAIPPLSTFFGSRELEAKVKPYIKADTIVLACDYGNASRAWYYLNKPQVYVLGKFRYSNTYRYWNTHLSLPIKQAIFVCDVNDPIDIKILGTYFSSIKLVVAATFNTKITHNKIYIFRATN